MNTDLKICIIGKREQIAYQFAHLITNTPHHIAVFETDVKGIERPNLSQPSLDHSAILYFVNQQRKDVKYVHRAVDKHYPDNVSHYGPRHPNKELPTDCDIYWVYLDVTPGNLCQALEYNRKITEISKNIKAGGLVICSTNLPVMGIDYTRNQLARSDVDFIYIPDRFDPTIGFARNLEKVTYVGVDPTSNYIKWLNAIKLSVPAEAILDYRTAEIMYQAERVEVAINNAFTNEVIECLSNANVNIGQYIQLKNLLNDNAPTTMKLDESRALAAAASWLHNKPNSLLAQAAINNSRTHVMRIVDQICNRWIAEREANPGIVVPLFLYIVTKNGRDDSVVNDASMKVLEEILRWSEGVNVHVIDPNPKNAGHPLLDFRTIPIVDSMSTLPDDVKVFRVRLNDHTEFNRYPSNRYDASYGIDYRPA